MPKDYSPFTPGRPVPAQQFVGRATEVERLRRAAAAAVATGRVQVAFLEGERGIGKSSASFRPIPTLDGAATASTTVSIICTSAWRCAPPWADEAA